MAPNARRALNAYGAQDLSAKVLSASPHQLTLMLYDGAVDACLLAQAHMAAGAIPEKCAAIAKALAIVQEGLQQSLDLDAGGTVAAALDATYQLVIAQLVHANATNDSVTLGLALNTLKELRSAWIAIGPSSVRQLYTP